MTASLFLSNLLAYSLQIGALCAVAAALGMLLKPGLPHARLAWWQVVLVACLALPAVRGWRQQAPEGSVQITTTILSAAPVAPDHTWSFNTPEILLGAVAAGAFARLCWLLMGLARLRRYRRNSRPHGPVSPWDGDAELRLSDEIQSPVTFGFRRPVVLLPARFPELGAPVREAILCHEVLHVRRGDWLFTLAEELIRAVLWFHPAIWWILGEIQLAREQAVDLSVIDMTRARDQYVDALLAIAGASPQLDLAPAPLFLRKRHLKQRVISILKEVRMSKKRTVFAFAASGILLAGSCWFITGAFPLEAAPQQIIDAPGVTVETGSAQIMHRGSVGYPGDAMANRVEGTVVAQVRLDGAGNVADATILSGPDELRKSVLQSVLGWHFTKDAANSTQTVAVTFRKAPGAVTVVRSGVFSGALAPQPPAEPRTVESIHIGGVPPQVRDELAAQIPVHTGDSMSAEGIEKLTAAVRKYDEHLGVMAVPVSPGAVALTIAPQAPPPPPPPPPPSPATTGPDRPIRIGGNAQQANLVTKVTPIYPADAKQARVQGQVRFEATIGKDGTIQSLNVVAGPPMLVSAAMDAVRQWIYRPTLLNGEPVAVITQIDVNFTLSQ